MRYEIKLLSRQLLDEYVESLILIDEDTTGERWRRRHFAAELPGKWECSWVAVGERGPVGFVVASVKVRSLHVHRIAVARSLRREGLGTMLLDRVAQCALERGIPLITLRVATRNQGAVRFYQRLGFNLDGSDPEHLSLTIPVATLLEAVGCE